MGNNIFAEYEVKKTHKWVNIVIYIVLAIWTLVNLFPIYWMFTFSLKDNSEIFGKNIAGLPTKWLWSNYSQAWNTGNMPRFFANSILITVVTIALTLIASIMATYAVTRIVWKGAKFTNSLFMLGLTIPVHSALVPIYKVLISLGLTNSYSALILPYSAFSLAMGILICTGFMQEIPKDLDEAAYIDGCSRWGTFFKVIVPLMKPAVATVSIYTFLQCWNEFMFASIFNTKKEYMTIPAGVQQLFGSYTTDWGPIGAALAIASFPTILAYIFLSRKIQDSFIAGAVKG